MLKVKGPRMVSSPSIRLKLPAEEAITIVPMASTTRKKNKIERSRESLIKWVFECINCPYLSLDKKSHKAHPNTALDFYLVGRVLGKGAFGKVNLCLHKLSGKLLAMKSLHKQYLASEHNKVKFQNEIALLRLLKHKNIIRLYETFSSGNLLLIVIELCAGGDLLTYVRKRKKLAEPVAKVAFKQVNISI